MLIRLSAMRPSPTHRLVPSWPRYRHRFSPCRRFKVLSPAEAVVAVAIEMKIGDNSGMLNLAVPSITIKMMGQKFDHQWTSRKTGAADQDRRRTLNLIRRARLTSDVRLNGSELTLRDLADLQQSPSFFLSTALPRSSARSGSSISAGSWSSTRS